MYKCNKHYTAPMPLFAHLFYAVIIYVHMLLHICLIFFCCVSHIIISCRLYHTIVGLSIYYIFVIISSLLSFNTCLASLCYH